MSSLKSFHFVFILIVFVAAELFGAWAMWTNSHNPDPMLLTAGVLSFVFSFAVVAYTVWLVRKLDRSKIK